MGVRVLPTDQHEHCIVLIAWRNESVDCPSMGCTARNVAQVSLLTFRNIASSIAERKPQPKVGFWKCLRPIAPSCIRAAEFSQPVWFTSRAYGLMETVTCKRSGSTIRAGSSRHTHWLNTLCLCPWHMHECFSHMCGR